MHIPDNVVYEVKERVDILETVRQYVPLKKSGASYIGKCCFHNDSHPSLVVSTQKQIVSCFVCNVSYDAIGFVQAHLQQSFPEAITTLAGQLGIHIPEEENPKYTPQEIAQQKQERLSLKETLNRATKIYQKCLQESPSAVQYLKERGFNEETIEAFKIGFAPNGNHLSTHFRDYPTNPQLIESGLVVIKEDGFQRYDRFRNRIVFPLLDAHGGTIAYSCRALSVDTMPKYLNSPEYSLFHKGNELYGLYNAKKSIRELNQAILVEGNADVLAMHQYGFTNTVACMGTAITVQHISMLFKLCDTIVVMLDGDRAGIVASWKTLELALPLITDQKSLKFVFLSRDGTDKVDPDGYLAEHGKEALQLRINKAMPMSRFLLGRLQKENPTEDAEGKAKFLQVVRTYLDRINAPFLYALIKSDISEVLKMDAAVVEAILNGNSKYAHQRKSRGGTKKPTHKVTEKKVPSIYIRPKELLIKMLLANPKISREWSFSEEGTYECESQEVATLLGVMEYLSNECDVAADIDGGRIRVMPNAETLLDGVLKGSTAKVVFSEGELRALVQVVFDR